MYDLPASPGVFLDPSWLPEPTELDRLRRVAAGAEPADRIIRGGRVLAMHTGEIVERDVVIAGRHIAAVTPVGRFDAPDTIDASGLHVAPTFIDSHMHPEYSMLAPGELARLTVPKGTTTILADPLCIGNVLGGLGIDIATTTDTPLRFLLQVSFQIPRAPSLELGGAVIPLEETLDRIRRPDAVAVGEGNPFDLDPDSATKQWAALAAGKRVVGHTARLSDEPLWAYLAGGVGDDHNAFNVDEVLERLRLGVGISVMAGSMNDNCQMVFQDVERLAGSFNHIMFCADDKHVGDLHNEGHIDHHVRQAIRAGVPHMAAWRMATLNAAVHYRADHVIGAVAPSRLADLQLVGDLTQARPELVLVDGTIAGENGVALFENNDVLPPETRGTIRLTSALSPELFRVPAHAEAAADGCTRATVRASEMYDGYFKRAFEADLPVAGNNVLADPSQDVLKIAILDRHHASEAIGIGFVKGFQLERGALATSTNCENMNLVILGADDASMELAAREMERLDGGVVVVADGNLIAACALPHAGIMSDKPWEEALADLEEAEAAARTLGCTTKSPFMILNFVGLPVVPDYGLTEKGLIDARTQAFVPVVVSSRCPGHSHD